MKYCMDFDKDNKYINKADEINVDYDKNNNIDDLLFFCEEHKKQRINLCINSEETNIELIKKCFEFQKACNQYDIYIRLPERKEELDILLTEYPDSKFYFCELVNDWDRVYQFIKYGVTDIFIVEGLGFELDKIASLIHANNIQIRVFPNVAQSSWKDLDDFLKFWIRPEDIGIYGEYIDVCEFFGEHTKTEILYEVYAKDKQWFGDLKELIIGLQKPLDSKYIIPRFA